MDRHRAQLALPEIGEEGQRALAQARVLIIGVGALGSVAAELLCRAGVGHLTLQDFDVVDESNLQRQALYTQEDIGAHKAEAARLRLRAIDPKCEVAVRLDPFPAGPDSSLDGHDLVIEGTDSLDARMRINDAARKAGVPLVLASAQGTRGMAFTAVPGGACWQCIARGKQAQDSCDEGVLGMATHAVASLQAAMALRALLGSPMEDLIETDVWEGTTRRVRVPRDPACEACRGTYRFLDARAPFSLMLCEGTRRLQARPSAPTRVSLDSLRKEGMIEDYGTAVRVRIGEGSALVHQHGLIEFEGVAAPQAGEFAKKIASRRKG